MNKKNQILLIVSILIMSLLIIGGSFAYWTLTSSVNKNVVFNTSKELAEYINYDEGESTFVGDFKVSDSYLDGIHSTISISKKAEANSTNLMATINMDIKSIGTNIANSSALKWVVTSGDSTNPGEVLSSGNFLGVNSSDTMLLLPSKEVKTTIQKYTIWIWLDASENPDSNLTGEMLDTVVWTEINLTEGLETLFEITKLTNNYQIINATSVNNKSKIVSYAITRNNSEPTEWIEIDTGDRNQIYNLEYTVFEVGTYYLWFKDSVGNVISDSINIETINTTVPTCIWGSFEPAIVVPGASSSVTLTCIGNDLSNISLTTDDIVLSNDVVILSDNIVKKEISNGYTYTFKLTGSSTIGETSIILPAGKIYDSVGNANVETVSNIIKVSNIYTITYKDVGNTEFSGVHEDGYPVEYMFGKNTSLDIPTKNGYTFGGYYLNSDGSGSSISIIEYNQSGDLTLYAKWIDKPPYGTASLSLSGGVFTLSLLNYGDDGSGLTGTYGYALIKNEICSSATYEDSTATSKTYSMSLVNNEIYYGCVKLTDNSGNVTYIKSNAVEVSATSGTQSYTATGQHTYNVPSTGTYKLEVWGAQGGSANNVGGYGGYSVGNVELTAGTTLYVYVGGQGSYSKMGSSTASGGINGGGNGVGSSSVVSSGSGGGATHIATISGELSSLSNYKGTLRTDKSTYDSSTILIVAGGGGGEAWAPELYEYSGGHAGGYEGSSSIGTNNSYLSSTVGKGGSQTAGGTGYKGVGVVGNNGTANSSYTGSFGKGASVTSKMNDSESTGLAGGGGGGGFFGGGIGGAKGGGGGSGYIGSSLLTDKYMYCYNCTTSNGEHTKTYTTTSVSSTPTADYAKTGNGAAKITYSIIEDVTPLVLTYDNNGGSGCASSAIVSGSLYGELCTPVKNGYKFIGWYTSATGGTEITSNTEVTVTENQTVYAHWQENLYLSINFESNGNDGYVSGDISSIINVLKGSNNLDTSTFKYIFSTDINAEPTESFVNGTSYVLEGATGVYYLIAKACDVEDNCVTKSSSPFYVDNTIPEGTMSLLGTDSSTIEANVEATDISGISSYGYLISSDGVCPTTGYISTNNSNYSFNVNESGTYLICVKITDGAGNSIVVSDSIEIVVSTITYALISSNYSCANSSAGSSPIFTYTGNCEVVNDGGNSWKVRFLSTGDLTFSEDIYVEAFLLGAGGSGPCDIMSAYDTLYCAAGGGGYHTNIGHSLHYDSIYTLTVGEPNGGSTSAFDTTVNGGGNGKVSSANFGESGDGGTECYEFEEETGDILYSGKHSVRGETPPANTGRGGWHASNGVGTTSGSSGIVIIRPKQSELSIVYNNTGGSGCGTKYAMFGDTYGELCTPVRDGYYFEGWYTSNSYITKVESTDAIPSSATVNLYAHWIQKSGPLILFDGGDITNITGGWGATGHKFSSGYTKLINDTQVGVYYSESLDKKLNKSFYAYTVNSIDLTLYDTLYMNITSVKGYTSNIFVHNGDIASLSDTSPAFSKSISAAVGVVSLDVSDLVGEYQIGMHTSMHGHQYGTVKYYIYADKVWLE